MSSDKFSTPARRRRIIADVSKFLLKQYCIKACKNVARMRLENSSAITIQCVFRLHASYVKVEYLKYLRKRKAAIVIQCMYRCCKARMRRVHLYHLKLVKCANVIKTMWINHKGWNAIKIALRKIRKELILKHNLASVVIQRCTRGLLIRNRVKRLRELRDKEARRKFNAATLIQCLVRKRIAYKKVSSLKHHIRCISIIKRNWIPFHRKRFKVRNDAAICIQKRTRGFLYRLQSYRHKKRQNEIKRDLEMRKIEEADRKNRIFELRKMKLEDKNQAMKIDSMNPIGTCSQYLINDALQIEITIPNFVYMDLIMKQPNDTVRYCLQKSILKEANKTTSLTVDEDEKEYEIGAVINQVLYTNTTNDTNIDDIDGVKDSSIVTPKKSENVPIVSPRILSVPVNDTIIMNVSSWSTNNTTGEHTFPDKAEKNLVQHDGVNAYCWYKHQLDSGHCSKISKLVWNESISLHSRDMHYLYTYKNFSYWQGSNGSQMKAKIANKKNLEANQQDKKCCMYKLTINKISVEQDTTCVLNSTLKTPSPVDAVTCTSNSKEICSNEQKTNVINANTASVCSSSDSSNSTDSDSSEYASESDSESESESDSTSIASMRDDLQDVTKSPNNDNKLEQSVANVEVLENNPATQSLSNIEIILDKRISYMDESNRLALVRKINKEQMTHMNTVIDLGPSDLMKIRILLVPQIPITQIEIDNHGKIDNAAAMTSFKRYRSDSIHNICVVLPKLLLYKDLLPVYSNQTINDSSIAFEIMVNYIYYYNKVYNRIIPPSAANIQTPIKRLNHSDSNDKKYHELLKSTKKLKRMFQFQTENVQSEASEENESVGEIENGIEANFTNDNNIEEEQDISENNETVNKFIDFNDSDDDSVDLRPSTATRRVIVKLPEINYDLKAAIIQKQYKIYYNKRNDAVRKIQKYIKSKNIYKKWYIIVDIICIILRKTIIKCQSMIRRYLSKCKCLHMRNEMHQEYLKQNLEYLENWIFFDDADDSGEQTSDGNANHVECNNGSSNEYVNKFNLNTATRVHHNTHEVSFKSNVSEWDVSLFNILQMSDGPSNCVHPKDKEFSVTFFNS